MIYVSKTSVKYKKHIRQLSPLLDDLLQKSECNIDLTDCDKILRIDSDENIVLKIKGLLNIYQFYCE